MTLKQKIYDHYVKAIDDNVKMLQDVLNDLKESGANETKSTAGDKHETALAMLQMEQANISGQLKQMLNKKTSLERINPTLSATTIVVGSLIKTSHGYLFLSAALGKATIDGVSVTALSPQSPLGTTLIGLSKGDSAGINNRTYIIESVE